PIITEVFTLTPYRDICSKTGLNIIFSWDLKKLSYLSNEINFNNIDDPVVNEALSKLTSSEKQILFII
ncbi:MAG: hypothetical protein K6F84_01385, partial [Lachnospiraceae bacterium]|nr:hypothetical protein [Lachnospiraceae bacterium]